MVIENTMVTLTDRKQQKTSIKTHGEMTIVIITKVVTMVIIILGILGTGEATLGEIKTITIEIRVDNSIMVM